MSNALHLDEIVSGEIPYKYSGARWGRFYGRNSFVPDFIHGREIGFVSEENSNVDEVLEHRAFRCKSADHIVQTAGGLQADVVRLNPVVNDAGAGIAVCLWITATLAGEVDPIANAPCMGVIGESFGERHRNLGRL